MIIRALAKKKKIVCIPYRKEKELKIVNEVIKQYMDEHNCYPTNEELSERLGISVKKVKKIKFSDVAVSYLEDTIDYEQSFSLESLVTDESYNPHETLINKDIEEDTQKALNSLLSRERAILIHRFGIDNSEKYTLKEMGNFFGISPETVRQIELKTLKKLEATYQNLKDYIYG
jgi:RNA polymerase primary sigma factor